MKMKLVVGGAGLFGLGALFGWAYTADRAEQNYASLEESLSDLIIDKTDQIFALKDQLEAVESELYILKTQEMTEERVLDSDPSMPSDDIQNESSEEEKSENEDEKIPGGEDSGEVSENAEEEEYSEEAYEEARTNLQEIIDRYTKRGEETVELLEHIDQDTKRPRHTPPFVISQEAYAWDEEGENHEKCTLTYYPKDRILLDDEESPVEDIAGTVGWRNLAQFGYETTDPNVVFVRNRRQMTDYEVVLDEENDLPMHVRYGMPREEFNAAKAAGLIQFRKEDV